LRKQRKRKKRNKTKINEHFKGVEAEKEKQETKEEEKRGKKGKEKQGGSRKQRKGKRKEDLGLGDCIYRALLASLHSTSCSTVSVLTSR